MATKRRDWTRAGEAVKRRRGQLGYSRQEDAAEAAGVGVTVWRQVEAGAPNKRGTTLGRIATALEWPADMIERIADGENPPADDPITAARERLEALEDRMAGVEAKVDGLVTLIGDLLRRGARR